MKEFKVGDLVRDKLNQNNNSYGLGVIVDDDLAPSKGELWDRLDGALGKKYSVYFTKFGKTITFHGDYLERVSED
jgi:hypothetical protein